MKRVKCIYMLGNVFSFGPLMIVHFNINEVFITNFGFKYVFFFILFICLDDYVFRCVLASLYEVVSVGWMDGPMDGPQPVFF